MSAAVILKIDSDATSGAAVAAAAAAPILVTRRRRRHHHHLLLFLLLLQHCNRYHRRPCSRCCYLQPCACVRAAALACACARVRMCVRRPRGVGITASSARMGRLGAVDYVRCLFRTPGVRYAPRARPPARAPLPRFLSLPPPPPPARPHPTPPPSPPSPPPPLLLPPALRVSTSIRPPKGYSSTCLPIHFPAYPSIFLPTHPFSCLPIHLPTYLWIDIYTNLSMDR